MNNQPRLIDADKLLAWLKIREGEAYTNADQVFNPSFLLGKADAFNDVVEYVKSGHSDLAPSPTIKPGDKVKHKSGGAGYGIGTVHHIAKSGKRAFVKPWGAYYTLDKLEVIESD